MSEKLEPCPFCGKKARKTFLIDVRKSDASDAVLCSNAKCRVRPSVTAETAEEARRLWNTRKQKEPPK